MLLNTTFLDNFVFLTGRKKKIQSGIRLLLIIKFVYLVNLRKVFSINLEELAVLLAVLLAVFF